MSGLTPIPLSRFRDQLGARGWSMEQLANQISCGRSHVSQVLWGHRPGGDTWALIRAVVTDAEWETLLQMEHCATWNAEQCAAGDTAMVWQMRVRCGWCKVPQGFKACVRASAGTVTDGICPECYAKQRDQIDQLAPIAATPLLENRAYLVRTEAGLAVHTSPTRPALADDRELSQAFLSGDAASAPIRCAVRPELSSSRFNDDTRNAPPNLHDGG